MSADRDGVHCTSTLKLVRRKPSLASLSKRGVASSQGIGAEEPLPTQRVQTQIELHDRYGFEIKIESRPSAPDPAANNTRKLSYGVSTYLFFPQNFRISAKSYPAKHFFTDAKAYMRRELGMPPP